MNLKDILKSAIEEKILNNIPAEINKEFLGFLDEYEYFFNAIDENYLSQIEVELRFYLPTRTFDTRLLFSKTNITEYEINISDYTLKDYAPSVRVTISIHTYENLERKIRDLDIFGIGVGEIAHKGHTYYIYYIQRLIALDKYFVMEYFL